MIYIFSFQCVKMKYFTLSIFVLLFISVYAKKFNEDDKPDWAKKDIRDFSEADMERLLDQWEVSKLELLLFIYQFSFLADFIC